MVERLDVPLMAASADADNRRHFDVMTLWRQI